MTPNPNCPACQKPTLVEIHRTVAQSAAGYRITSRVVGCRSCTFRRAEPESYKKVAE